MDVSDYFTLMGAPERWLHRGDLSEHAEEFLASACSRVRANVVAGHEIVRTTFTITASTYALPADFVSFTAVPLTYMVPEELYRHAIYSESSGPAQAYTVDGRTLVVAPAQTAFDLSVSYRSLVNVTQDTPTNWLLTAYPDLYRHAMLAEACDFIQDLEKLQYHEAKFTALAKRINAQQQWAT